MYFDEVVFIVILWIIFYEIYISCVIYSFYKKSVNGAYGPLCQEPILPTVGVELKTCIPFYSRGLQISKSKLQQVR